MESDSNFICIIYLYFSTLVRVDSKRNSENDIIIKLYLHVAFAEFKWYVKKSRTTRLNISAPDFRHTPTLNPLWILFTTLTNPLHPKSLYSKFNYKYLKQKKNQLNDLNTKNFSGKSCTNYTNLQIVLHQAQAAFVGHRTQVRGRTRFKDFHQSARS